MTLIGTVSVAARLSAVLDAGLSGELSTGLSALGAAGLAGELRLVGQVAARLAAYQARVLAAVEQARLDGGYGSATTVEVLARCQPVTLKQARTVARLADAVTPRATLQGEPLPADAPQVAAGLTAGTVTTDQAGVILEALEALPTWVSVETVTVVEQSLIEACPYLHPIGLRRLATQLIALIQQDGPEPDDPTERRRRLRGLHRRVGRDGMIRYTLDLTPEDDELFTATVESLSAPVPAADDAPDPRTPAQRGCDAVLEMCQRLITSGSLPHAGGAPVTVLVTMTLAELQAQRGIAITAHGTPWPVPDLLTSAADYLPLITEPNGAPLHLGRAVRLATIPQRRALAARDGGCTFPGCDRPPAWCEAHHVTDWADGGTTDTSNMILLCRHHHREHARQGWQVQVRNGHPEWTPPAWVDPARTPVRNAARHRPVLGLNLRRRPTGCPAVDRRPAPGRQRTANDPEPPASPPSPARTATHRTARAHPASRVTACPPNGHRPTPHPRR